MNKHLVFLISALLLQSTWTNADILELNDGSSITGKILRIEADTVTIETTFADKLGIARDLITGIETETPVYVEFSSGNTIHGELSASTASGAQVVSTDGKFNSTLDQISALWQPEDDSPAVKALEA